MLHLKKTPLSYLIALTLFLSLPSCSSLRYVSGDHQASTTWTKQELKPQKRRPVTSSQRQQERGTTRLPREVSSLLERSGVKMAAVEFYATWCKPCMEAVPRWKALHDKYRAQGLRLIVINTQDPNGACTAPGWAPDELVCDLEGHVAEAMKVGTLPSAFLYSLQGNTLVKRGHIDEVEREIEAYMLIDHQAVAFPVFADQHQPPFNRLPGTVTFQRLSVQEYGPGFSYSHAAEQMHEQFSASGTHQPAKAEHFTGPQVE